MDKKDTYTPKEVAAIMNHDESTVNRWCNKGWLHARKPFGRWVITRGAMLTLMFAFGLLAGKPLEEFRAMQREGAAEVRQATEALDAAMKQQAAKRQEAAAARKRARLNGGRAHGGKERRKETLPVQGSV